MSATVDAMAKESVRRRCGPLPNYFGQLLLRQTVESCTERWVRRYSAKPFCAFKYMEFPSPAVACWLRVRDGRVSTRRSCSAERTKTRRLRDAMRRYAVFAGRIQYQWRNDGVAAASSDGGPTGGRGPPTVLELNTFSIRFLVLLASDKLARSSKFLLISASYLLI